jgi:hypothetical protein
VVGGSVPPVSTDRPRYWISTVSLDHVLGAVAGGFTQADHGKDTRLRRLARGDGIAFYSPRTALRTGRPLQQFTALGVVADDEPYRAGPHGHWRRRVDFESGDRAAAVPVRPLLPVLGFVDDEERWGLPFRRGLFEVQAGDFAAIAGAMHDRAAGLGPGGVHVIGGAQA